MVWPRLKPRTSDPSGHWFLPLKINGQTLTRKQSYEVHERWIWWPCGLEPCYRPVDLCGDGTAVACRKFSLWPQVSVLPMPIKYCNTKENHTDWHPGIFKHRSICMTQAQLAVDRGDNYYDIPDHLNKWRWHPHGQFLAQQIKGMVCPRLTDDKYMTDAENEDHIDSSSETARWVTLIAKM